MALVQGGGAMNFLGPSTYNFMCGMKPADIIVSEGEITDHDVILILEKVPILLSLCVCVCVCVRACVRACARACTCVCVYIHMYVCVCM